MLTQSTRILIAAAICCAAILALNIWRPFSSSELPPAAPSAGVTPLADVGTMIANLEERLKNDSTDGEGFRMLGWSYLNTNKPAEAAAAYEQATRLLPGRADIRTNYGEALVAASGGILTPEARSQFEQALKLDPAEQRARGFLNQSRVPSKVVTDEANLIAEPNTVANLPIAEREAMISAMVERLAARLRNEPRDADGWVKLIRSRIIMGNTVQAQKDVVSAQNIFKSDDAELEQINAIARQYGF